MVGCLVVVVGHLLVAVNDDVIGGSFSSFVVVNDRVVGSLFFLWSVVDHSCFSVFFVVFQCFTQRCRSLRRHPCGLDVVGVLKYQVIVSYTI